MKYYNDIISACLIIVLNLISLGSLSQNLIKNGNFEDNNGCTQMVDPDCQITPGNISGFCLAHWETNHGTPNLSTVLCNSGPHPIPNSIVRMIGEGDDYSGDNEGIFQQVNLIPGSTYRLCFWLAREFYAFPDRSEGVFRVSLGNSSPGLPAFGDPCLDASPALLTVAQVSVNSYSNWTKFQSLPFTVPIESNYDRIIFWVKADNDYHAEVTQIDNITLFKETCEDNWTITQPGFLINEGNYEYSDFIHVISTNSSSSYIASESDGNVKLQAGNQIIIKPGFVSQVQSSGSLLLKIADCDVLNNDEICHFAPCFSPSTFEGNNEYEEGGNNERQRQANSTSSTISVFPNPISVGELNVISGETILSEIQIYNSYGKKVLFNSHQEYIDVSSLKTGIYLMKLISVEGDIYVRKFVKN